LLFASNVRPVYAADGFFKTLWCDLISIVGVTCEVETDSPVVNVTMEDKVVTPPPAVPEPVKIATSTTQIIRESPTYVTNEYITSPVIREIVRETVRESGRSSSSNNSNFVSQTLFDAQVNATHNSIENSVDGISDSIAESVDTELLTVTGNASLSTLTLSSITGGVLVADANGVVSTTTIGATSITDNSLDFNKLASALTVDATTTFDLDTNGADLNFDSGTFFIDSSTNRVGVGTTSPSSELTIDGSLYVTGAFYDKNNSAGTNGYILQSNGNGSTWVSTSSIGITEGVVGEPFVIFATGQSNFSTTNTYNWTVPDNVRIWNNQNNTTDIGDAFIDPSGATSTSNVPLMFAAEVARNNPNRTVYLVNVSVGGQAIAQWFNGASAPNMYVATRENISDALATLTNKDTIDLFMWWQGESDRARAASGAYKVDWDTVETAYQDESWFESETPQLIFGINTTDNPTPASVSNYDDMSLALHNIADDKSQYRKFVFTGDLMFDQSGAVGVHLGGQGQQDAARRAYNAFANGYKRNILQGGYVIRGNASNTAETTGDLFIADSGNIGIGTTSPSAPLTIYRPTGTVMGLFRSGNNRAVITVEDNDTDANMVAENGIASFGTYDYVINNNLNIDGSGKVGIGTTTPGRKLSVVGTVGFSGLTGSSGAGSLCLSSSGEVVYNSGSDSCLPSVRELKHNINELSLSASVEALLQELNPVSFIYNYDDTDRTRYGFIADEAFLTDKHLVTYDADGEISGLDTNGFLALIVSAIKDIYAKIAGFAESFTTKELCLDDVCITSNELRVILDNANLDTSSQESQTEESTNNSNQNNELNTNNASSAPSDIDLDESDDTASSTPETSEEDTDVEETNDTDEETEEDATGVQNAKEDAVVGETGNDSESAADNTPEAAVQTTEGV